MNQRMGRLARLEAKVTPIRGCPACIDQIDTARIVSVDEDGRELSASRPEHCPACGERVGPLTIRRPAWGSRPPLVGEIRLRSVDWRDI